MRVADPVTGARTSIGTFATKAEAEVALGKAFATQEKGGWVAPSRGRLTLEAYAGQWLSSRLTARGEPLRPNTQRLYETFLSNHILPPLGAAQLSQLTTARIRAWHGRVLAEGPGPQTAAKCYRLLRTILGTAVEDGLIAVNPCTIKGAGVEPSEERAIPTLAEVDALASTIRPSLRLFVLLAAVIGLRRGELLGLTRRNVDLLHRTIEVRVQRQEKRGGGHVLSEPKTDAGQRTLVIPSSLVPELEAHLDQYAAPGPDGVLFQGTKGGPLRVVVWQREWTRTRRALGLEHVHLHDLRHVAGTLAASTGAGTKELMYRLGHASPRAALLYQHATAQRDAAIADAIDAQLEAGRAEPTAPVVRLTNRPRRAAG